MMARPELTRRTNTRVVLQTLSETWVEISLV